MNEWEQGNQEIYKVEADRLKKMTEHLASEPVQKMLKMDPAEVDLFKKVNHEAQTGGSQVNVDQQLKILQDL